MALLKKLFMQEHGSVDGEAVLQEDWTIFRQLSSKIQLSFVLFFFYFSVQSLEKIEFFPGFTYIFYLFHERLNTLVL